MKNNEIFEDLFVLELANNHWGDVERGKQIVREHGNIVKKYGVKAAIKFQFRDVDTFIHNNFKLDNVVEREGEVVQAPGSSSRYIKKTEATKLNKKEFTEILNEVKRFGMFTMATPFDEIAVEMLNELDIDIAKIASQDARAWTLIEKVVELKKPTIISNGGTDIEDLDRVVNLFEKKDVPLAINHCVSLYPSEDSELELNQIDYLKKRYSNHVIGFSTHEYNDWHSSIMIAYAKGARTFERHVDIEDAVGTPVSKYCSVPHQVDLWFKAFKKAQEMIGEPLDSQREISKKEREYVKSVSRGAYAVRDLKKGHKIIKEKLGVDFNFAIPLQDGQLSARDMDKPVILKKPLKSGDPIPLEG